MKNCEENCFKCESCNKCEIHPDPDPYDWFCDDDVAVYCAEKKEYIAQGLRPYEVKNVLVPVSKCPLMAKKESNDSKA